MERMREAENMNMSQHPPAKRARLNSSGDDEHRPGSIVEIEVKNFMTYGHIKSQPGPRLNLVIGPNGTGKSSLVCAIGLGLGGEPQLLGRSNQIGDFVRRGEEAGWVKISLRGDSPDETLVIKRKINKRNKSEWLFNDHTITKKEIQDKVRKYNIQLNNLTQFLPQDRVSEFAKLSPVQLLEETEKAVGNPELQAQHQALIARSEEMKKVQVALKSHEESLAHVKASNAELEEDKQRMHQRAQLLEKAANMKKKVPWLKYEEKNAAFKEAKLAEKSAESVHQKCKDRCRELKATFDPLRRTRDKARAVTENLREMKGKTEQQLREVGDQETELGAKVRTKLNEIQDVHRKEAQRQERLVKAMRDVGLAATELENLPESKPQHELLSKLRSEIEQFHMEIGDKRSQAREREALVSQQKNALEQCNRRLTDINSVNARLLQALKNAGAHQIVSAYEWVEAHRAEFKKEVFGPVLLEVRIPHKSYAAYVENHVPMYIWKSFITQDAGDRDLLVRNLKQFDVPVINQTPTQSRSTQDVTAAMEQIGIVTRLDLVIDAPPVVKMVLIGQANLDHSFIGTAETNRRADVAPRLGVRDLWTPENHYRWQESRYGSHISASVNPVRPSRLFSENIDLREKNELEQRKAQLESYINELEASIKECYAQGRVLENESYKLEQQRKDIVSRAKLEKKKLDDMKSILEQRKRKLKSIQSEEGSADAERRLRALIKDLSSQRVRNLIKLKDILSEAVDTSIRYAIQHLNALELDAKVKELENNLRKDEAEAQQAERIFAQCCQVTEECKEQRAQAKVLAQSTACMTPDLKKEFEEMPDSVGELEDAIADLQAQAAAVICNNENAIWIYEQRCEEIQNLTRKVTEKRNALDDCLKDIETIQGSWLPTLRELVSNINETFSRNFMEMAVAGEVSLDEHGTDFDQYGILIKVKFRESGSLQVLSAHHQSGGERSVATILYLVSLQDLTYCPFRVVDEINQGMDPTNERKMFQQLVRAASQPKTPQCLLLTPKLLPDLEYTEACTILNVMNGPWIEEASKSRWSDGVSWSVMSQLIPTQ